MPKILLLCCAVFICISQLRAQVAKDTIRTKIDYRHYHPLKYAQAINRKNAGNPNSQPAQAKVLTNKKDTVRSSRDYRINNKRIQSKKAYTHYLGIQLNHILKLPSGNNNGSIILSNPYGLIYTFNHARTGYGIGFGIGYVSSYNKKNVSVGRPPETAEEMTSFRIGPQKQNVFGKHWIVGASGDLLFSQGSEMTRNFNGGLIQETEQKKKRYGFGPRAIVQYRCWNNRMRIGTELCWYFEKLKTTTREEFSGLPAEYSRSHAKSSTFLQPVSIFISIGIW